MCVCVSKGKVLIGFAIISISKLELTVVVLAYFATTTIVSRPQTSSSAYNASSIRVGFGSGAETTTANSQSDWSEIT